MRCEEALRCWQQDLLGQPLDQDALEEAYAHIGACQNLCARTLSAAPDFGLFDDPAWRTGQTDLYEALGLSAEEEGDAHAREWARLSRLAARGKAKTEAVEHERAMALAAWQSAANYYRDGLRVSRTPFLNEGLKRIKHKRLESPEEIRAGLHRHDPRRPLKQTSTHAKRPAAPEEGPKLELISQASASQITVAQRPAGWQIGSPKPSIQLALRENATALSSATADTRSIRRSVLLGRPHVNGTLDPFALSLWASESSRKWELELLVRAHSPRQPWTGVRLTLEHQEQGGRRPTTMQFARRAARMSGWWARLKEVETGAYQLRLSANDARSKASEDVTLELHLIAEEQAGG